MFYVIDRRTGEEIHAKGFWAISEGGNLYDIIDGWGCEGGGGSSCAPDHAVAVFGVAPSELPVEQKPEPKPQKIYRYRCSCGARFVEYSGSLNHCTDTRQPGPHIISEV